MWLVLFDPSFLTAGRSLIVSQIVRCQLSTTVLFRTKHTQTIIFHLLMKRLLRVQTFHSYTSYFYLAKVNHVQSHGLNQFRAIISTYFLQVRINDGMGWYSGRNRGLCRGLCRSDMVIITPSGLPRLHCKLYSFPSGVWPHWLNAYIHLTVIRELISKDVFEQRTSTGSVAFFLSRFLKATKFVFASVFSLLEMICPKIWSTSQPKITKRPLPVDVHHSKLWLLKLPNKPNKMYVACFRHSSPSPSPYFPPLFDFVPHSTIWMPGTG